MIPVLGLWIVFGLVIALRRPRVRTRAQFRTRYAHAWRWITRRWHQWFEGRVGLVTCLALLVVFTFAYHYPVFAQRGIVIGAGSDSGCPTPAAVDSLWPPLRFGWDLMETRCASIRRLLPEKEALGETQSIYAQGALSTARSRRASRRG